MRKMTMMLMLSVAVLLVAATAQAAIVLQNGSFEDGTLTGGGGAYEAIGDGVTFENWTSNGGSAYVGHYSGWGITPDDGAEIMNIRNHAAATLSQSVGTVANATENDITLTFKYQQIANSPSFKAGLYDAATGGNILAETAFLSPSRCRCLDQRFGYGSRHRHWNGSVRAIYDRLSSKQCWRNRP